MYNFLLRISSHFLRIYLRYLRMDSTDRVYKLQTLPCIFVLRYSKTARYINLREYRDPWITPPACRSSRGMNKTESPPFFFSPASSFRRSAWS